MKQISFIFLIVLFSNFSLLAQSFKNLEGTYYVTKDSIVHSYHFNNGKLIVNLNINDFYKIHFSYHYNYYLNDDNTLKVVLIDIRSEEANNIARKKKKRKSYIADLYMMSGYFFSIWTLERIEDNKLTIKVEPRSIKWPASKGHLANYYSGFENSFTLVPHIE